MKNLMLKIKTKSFWVSLVAGVVLILQTLGIKVNVPYVNEILESCCAVMLMLGIFTAPPPAKTIGESELAGKEETTEENVVNKSDNILDKNKHA